MCKADTGFVLLFLVTCRIATRESEKVLLEWPICYLALSVRLQSWRVSPAKVLLSIPALEAALEIGEPFLSLIIPWGGKLEDGSARKPFGVRVAFIKTHQRGSLTRSRDIASRISTDGERMELPKA